MSQEVSKRLPSWELTYPPKKLHFEDDFPFPKVGYVNPLEGSKLVIFPVYPIYKYRLNMVKCHLPTIDPFTSWDIQAPFWSIVLRSHDFQVFGVLAS